MSHRKRDKKWNLSAARSLARFFRTQRRKVSEAGSVPMRNANHLANQVDENPSASTQHDRKH